MQNKCFGVVGEGSLENSHSIIEQYRPSPFVAMLIRSFMGVSGGWGGVGVAGRRLEVGT